MSHTRVLIGTRNWIRRLCGCGLLLAFAAGLVSTGLFAADRKQSAAPAKKKVIVIAHRGAHQKAPENSLAAVRGAIEFGCDYVELDVRTTRDGALVLMHDSSVDRTTDGTGKVAEMTLAEIRRVKFDTPSKAKKDKGALSDEPVPTFEEALLAGKGKIKIYIDHKDASPKQIMDLLKKHDMLDEVIVYSSVESLRTFKKLRPSIPIMPDHPGTVEKIEALARDLKPETLDGHFLKWNQEQVDAAHRAGIEVWLDIMGPVDNDQGYQKALEMGVDALQTDNPKQLIAFLKKAGRR